jgi:proteasome accessory factor C
MTLAASDRVNRLLSIVPFVAAHRDGVAVDELCRRFDIDRTRLLADLDTLSMVGVAPYTPDTMVDVIVDDDRVQVFLPQWFDRPLRMTAEQALALLVAGQSALAVPGADPDGPLARGLAKVAAVLGVDNHDVLAIDLGEVGADSVAVLRDAIAARHRIRIDYYAYGRDERSTRDVDPYRVFADKGAWYLTGWCHVAGDERLFRLDRMASIEVLADTFEPPTEAPELGVFEATADAPRVHLRLSPAARWVAEAYPVESGVEHDDGRLEVTLAITAIAWLERLVLGLGPDVEVVDGQGTDLDLRSVGPAAAARVLARYRASGP